MGKYVLTFIAGGLTVVGILAVLVAVSSRQGLTSAASQVNAPTAILVIRVKQDTDKLRVANDASTVLDQITNLTGAEKKKIRDGIASGLITGVELRSEVGGETKSVTIPVHSSGLILRSSSSGHFELPVLRFEKQSVSDPATPPTPASVTPADAAGH